MIYFFPLFLVACTRLYKPLCPLVCLSVCRWRLGACDLWRLALFLCKSHFLILYLKKTHFFIFLTPFGKLPVSFFCYTSFIAFHCIFKNSIAVCFQSNFILFTFRFLVFFFYSIFWILTNYLLLGQCSSIYLCQYNLSLLKLK